MSQHFKKNYYHIYSHNNYYFNFKNFFVTFLIYLSNFGKELILCLLLKCFHKTKIFNSKKILYANFPNHWNLKNKYYKLLEKNNNNKYLISLLRNNSSALTDYKNFFLLKESKIINMNILESYNSITDIIFIYFANLITKNQNVTNDLLLVFHL